jgi:hypothetical protein
MSFIAENIKVEVRKEVEDENGVPDAFLDYVEKVATILAKSDFTPTELTRGEMEFFVRESGGIAKVVLCRENGIPLRPLPPPFTFVGEPVDRSVVQRGKMGNAVRNMYEGEKLVLGSRWFEG